MPCVWGEGGGGVGGVLSQVVSSELETAALLREREVALRSRG